MNPWIRIAGWTLVHFAWQGAVIALTAVVALRLLRTASAQARYAVACAALAGMLVTPVITARVLSASAAERIAQPVKRVVFFRHLGNDPGAAPLLREFNIPASPERTEQPVPLGLDAFPQVLDSFSPMLVAVWLAGVAFFVIRLVGGWWRVRRLHRTSLAVATSRWQPVAVRLASRLHLGRAIHVVDSLLINTPTVLGWWRPIVLLPVAALANLSPAQVESILAHELAHIRRHDYLVNLLQTVAETLLFYHPAVWWVSTRIRTEREHCCDDVAVAVCGDAVGYAEALAELETWRMDVAARTTAASLALAATDGSLLERVRRVLRARADDPRRSLSAPPTVALVFLFVVIAGGLVSLPTLQATDARSTTDGVDRQAKMIIVERQIVNVDERRALRLHQSLQELPALGESTQLQFIRVRLGQSARQPDAPGAHAQSTAATSAAQSSSSTVSGVQAQSPASDGSRTAFETASVKPNKSGAPRVGIGLQPGGLYTATNVTLQILIQNAYRVQPFQVTGGPSWMTSDRFDIVAKAGVALVPGQLQLMVQSLLADRFKLTVHRETREQPVFALVLARADGKIGAQLRKSESDCSGPQPAGRANVPTPPGPPAPGQAGPCGITFGLGRLTANGTNMAQLATDLSGRVNRVVVDRTGLSGAFDVDLQWTPDPSEGAGPLGSFPPQLDGPPRPASDGPTLVTALQEQLGLKLDAQRSPVEVLVIDRVEHPTDD